MKNYILFKNKGEIDVNHISLLGVSTKEDDNDKIGFWGSGLKYSLATLMRNNVGIKMFSGEKEIKIEKVPTKVGEQMVDVIHVDGDKTSITTRAGKDWELWFSIREIHSNQIDSGSASYELADPKKIIGEKGQTSIYIELTDDINEISKDYDKYFAFKRKALHEYNGNKVYDRKGSFYRKGIRSNDKDYPTSKYDYDFDDVSINESRVFMYTFQISREVGRIVASMTDSRMIDTIFADRNSFEQKHADFDNVGKFTAEIVKYLQGYIVVNENISGRAVEKHDRSELMILSDGLYSALRKAHTDELNFYGSKHIDGFDMCEDQAQYRDTIMEALREIREDGKGHVISVGYFSGDTLGEYNRTKQMILLDESIIESKKLLQNTLLEEIMHKESGAGDCTRKFQNHIINRTRLALTEKKQ